MLVLKAPKKGHRFKGSDYVLVAGNHNKRRWHRPNHPQVTRQVMAMVARAHVAGRRFRPAIEALALECGVPNSYVLYRTKLPERVIEKMIRKGKTLQDIPDYVGYAIVTRDLSQMTLITARVPMLERSGVKILKLEARPHGSVIRAVHADLDLEGISAELQILPWWVKVWSEWDHDTIYKPPPIHRESLPALRAYSLDVLLWCFAVQHDRSVPPPPCPPEAQALGLCFPHQKVLSYTY